MAIVPPSLSDNYLLNTWPVEMGEYGGTFNQCSGKGSPLTNSHCKVYISFDRDSIARSLDDAESKIARILRYWPRPRYLQDVLMFGAGIPRGQQMFQALPVKNGGSFKLIEFGKRATSIIQAAAAVVYSDVGGYGVTNTATITVAAGALTNVDEVGVFFQVADQQPNAAQGAGIERYQITPVQVTLTGGNFVITAPKEMFVKPTIWGTPFIASDPNQQEINAANYNDPLSFVTAVDVYRVYTDTSTQLEVLDWNNKLIQNFNGVIMNADAGIFSFEETCLNDVINCCCQRPVKLRVNYRAGLPLVNGYMDNELQTAIIRLANNLAPVELCPFCARTKDRWAQDRNPAVKDRYPIVTKNAVMNEWGILTNGTIYAYNTAIGKAINIVGRITKRWI